MQHTNSLGQPIGFPVKGWQERPRPPATAMSGRYCTLVPLDSDKHTQQLYQAYAKDPDQHNWTYLPYGPFTDFASYRSWLEENCCDDDPMFHTVLDNNTGKAVGVASYLRINPTMGVIEIGHIHFSPLMQRTPMATEAMYQMMRRVFDELGYRRYEWKCDSLNKPSNRAAERLGFTFEGIFRQLVMYKGRNRDTAWYSIIDSEWPNLKSAFEAWLDPDNFKADGQQKKSLSFYQGREINK